MGKMVVSYRTLQHWPLRPTIIDGFFSECANFSLGLFWPYFELSNVKISNTQHKLCLKVTGAVFLYCIDMYFDVNTQCNVCIHRQCITFYEVVLVCIMYAFVIFSFLFHTNF